MCFNNIIFLRWLLYGFPNAFSVLYRGRRGTVKSHGVCHLSVEIYILHLQGDGDSWGARLQMLSHPLGSRWVPCCNSRPGGFWTIWTSFPCQRWKYISNAKQRVFWRILAQAREALVQLRGTGATLLFHAECELEDEEDLVLSNIHIIIRLGLPSSRWPTSCSPGWRPRRVQHVPQLKTTRHGALGYSACRRYLQGDQGALSYRW